MIPLLILFALIVLAINLYATIMVARSDCYEIRQKLFQVLLIWLIPLLGGSLAITLLRRNDNHRATTDYADRRDDGIEDAVIFNEVSGSLGDLGSSVDIDP